DGVLPRRSGLAVLHVQGLPAVHATRHLDPPAITHVDVPLVSTSGASPCSPGTGRPSLRCDGHYPAPCSLVRSSLRVGPCIDASCTCSSRTNSQRSSSGTRPSVDPLSQFTCSVPASSNHWAVPRDPGLKFVYGSGQLSSRTRLPLTLRSQVTRLPP